MGPSVQFTQELGLHLPTSHLPSENAKKTEADRKGIGMIRGQPTKRADRGICICSFGAEGWGGGSTQDWVEGEL